MQYLRIFVVFSIFIACNAYKILFLAPLNGKSHFLYMSSFVRALLDRGHEVTFLTSNSMKHLNLANYTEILIDPPLDLLPPSAMEELINNSDGPILPGLSYMVMISQIINGYSFENANVQQFIKSTGLHFDVIVMEEFFSDSFLMFAHKHKAPVVTICTYGSADFIDRRQGLLSSPSVVPHHLLSFSDNMSFIERIYNTLVVAYDLFIRDFKILPSEEAFAQKYFAHLAPLPPLEDLVRNVSVNLVNTHRAISQPRPSMPSVIPIGGAHIKPVKALPTDLQTFLDESKHGAIYFSLGSNMQSSKMPKQMLQAFFETFKNLKQRVLWKFEDESITDIPSNVMVRKWMPQNDILAHPNVILFISHGGLFGTIESLYFGVPMLVIPLFGDQFKNARRISDAGYGKLLKYQEITKESFSTAISEILSDESYLAKAKHTAEVFKDNVVPPMDEAMFWIEHVAKFKGAKHLKSHAVNMSWFSYLLLDIALVNGLAVLVVVLVLHALIKMLFRKRKTEKVSKKKKQK